MKRNAIPTIILLITLLCFSTYIYHYIHDIYLYSKFKQDYDEYLKKYQNREIILTNTQNVQHFRNEEVIKEDTLHCMSKYKIIIQLNGNCGKCINTLKEWSIFLQKIKFPNENLIVYVHADNYAAFEYVLLANKSNDYYIINDCDSSFLKVNSLDTNNRDALLNSCIIDGKNKLVGIGSPFLSLNIKEEYLKLLTNYDRIEKYETENRKH